MSRIETLFVAFGVDPDGEESILGSGLEGLGMVPLVTSNEKLIPYIEKSAQLICNESENLKYTIGKFTRVD